jgi:hypothetical protein
MTRATSAAVLSVLLYLTLAVAVGHVDYHIRSVPERGFAEYSPGVVAGTEGAPGRYRILGPFAYDGLTRVTGLAPRESWILFRWLCLFAAFLAAHHYFSTWFARGPATTGVLLIAALVPLTFTNSWAHPDHLLELFLFTAGCAAVVRERDGWFAAVLVAAALNRETSAFLLPLYALARPLTRPHLLRTAGMAAIWLATYLGLRVVLGFESYDPWQLGRNLEFLSLTGPLAGRDPYYLAFGWFVVVMSAPLVWAAAASWPTLPRPVRAGVAVAAPLLFVTGLLFSSVIESRIFTPLLPLLAPALLFALFDRAATSDV